MSPEQQRRASAFKDALSDMGAAQIRLIDADLMGAADEVERARHAVRRQYAEFLAPIAAEIVEEMGAPV
jgi:hypothetical protein